jgi:hypothetical protein
MSRWHCGPKGLKVLGRHHEDEGNLDTRARVDATAPSYTKTEQGWNVIVARLDDRCEDYLDDDVWER